MPDCSDEYLTWSIEKLLRKIDQEYEMAGCARQDEDKVDEMRRLKLVELYRAEIRERLC
jgi:hypothetical protein